MKTVGDGSRNLRAIIEAIPLDLSSLPCRIVPSSFNPDDPDLRALPIPLSWHWTSCERMLAHFQAELVMILLPLFWQLTAPLQAAIRSAGAAAYIGDPENMPVNEAAVRAGFDTVVISASDAPRFAAYLTREQAPFPTSWLVIHLPDATTWDIPQPLLKSACNIAQEVHLFPGFPLLHQSPELSDGQTPRFLLSDDLEWEITETATYITTPSDHPIPFRHTRIPIFLSIVGEEQGKPIVEKRV